MLCKSKEYVGFQLRNLIFLRALYTFKLLKKICMQFINNFLQKKRKHFNIWIMIIIRGFCWIYTIIIFYKFFFLKCDWIVWGRNPIKWRHFLRAFCRILSNQQPRNYRPHAISLENQISLLSARIFVFLVAIHIGLKFKKKSTIASRKVLVNKYV